MKVGIYFDLRNPPEWPQDPTRLYGFALEMCEEANASAAIRCGPPSTTCSTTAT